NSRGGKRNWVDDQVPAEEDRSDQQVKAFLAAEDLSQYPRAGVIVATSGDQDTHEWARYQSGILSHELRSALSGAADVNGSGRIELSSLKWRPRAIASRGALDQTFRQDLYKVPYGRGFYDGYVATSGDLPVDEGTPFVVVEPHKSVGRHRIALGYLMTTPAINGTGMSHGVDVRYAFNVWGPLELGIAAQVGYGSGDQDQHMTRFAGLIYWGAQYLPKPWMALRLDAGLGWQLLSGKYFLNNDEHNQPVFAVGTEPRSLRFEAAGG